MLQWTGSPIGDLGSKKSTIAKFGDKAGSPIGRMNADGKAGFRVEFDDRNGAHINT